MRANLNMNLGEERRARLDRLVEALNAKSDLTQTNITMIVKMALDRFLPELEAQAGLTKKNKDS